MSLHDDIAKEIEENRLATPWTTADLVANINLIKEHKESHLRTTPANYSISLPGLDLGTGYNSKQQTNPRYFRVGQRNDAILYSLTQHVHPAQPPKTESSETSTIQDNSYTEAIIEDEKTNHESNIAAKEICNEGIKAIQTLINEMHKESPWNDRLENYLWNGKTFFETQEELKEIMWEGSVFSRLISNPEKITETDKIKAIEWACNIFKWGGTRQRKEVTWKKIEDVLKNANSNETKSTSAPINSGYTKVASFATDYLEKTERTPQAINDSRVAASLTSRLDEILINMYGNEANPDLFFNGLGRVDAARGGTRPRKLKLSWPNAYQSWRGQFAATAVVKVIRDILNSDNNYPPMPTRNGDGSPWTIRGVEAVLFMDGY